MKKILVPVDFSSHTKTVCKYAIEIAKTTGGELRLFHAYFDFVISTNTTFPYTVEANEMFNQEMMVNIRKEAKDDILNLQTEMIHDLKAGGVGNVNVVYTLTGGLPEEEIINVSETYAPDLIIMGTRGRGEKDILTGKVSSKVVQNASCRILTVPRNAQYHGFENVLYTTDFNDDDADDIKKLIELVSNYNPRIYCIHVDKEQKAGDVKEKMDALKKQFDQEVIKGEIIFDTISSEHFLDCINDFVNEKAIDLVAVVNRRKGFLKRLFVKDHTRELLFHANVPLYIFPGRDE